LKVSVKLTTAATWMSEDMAANNRFDHTDSLGRGLQARLTFFGYGSNAGENIASTGPTGQNAFDAWLASTQGHKEEMENVSRVAVGISKNGKVVAYMGDDKVNECVYKFISKNNYDRENRKKNEDILDEGDLYVADFLNNKWQLLDFEKSNELKNNFRSQADVLVNCDKASKIAGGTECNRPEDIEINPADNSLFISFTNNSGKKDYFGSIVRIVENDNNFESLSFEWEVFAKGGADTGFSCPDNLTFDNDGNLWVLCDISTTKLNKDIQKPFKNNSLFMIPVSGENKGKAFLFASGPVECEMCGGAFTPDGSTMFISVQHPGEGTVDYDNPTSRWPMYGDDIPRPALVAVTGFKK